MKLAAGGALGALFRATVPAATASTAPLLTAEDIATLAAQASHYAQRRSLREVHGHQAGDWPSAVLGRGLDFEEARPYNPGDDLRDMDWRTTARLGHPYIKVYREERQPVLHLVVDRGPSMRFGTRRRLKVCQAARLATLSAFAAAAANLAVGASLWDGSDRDFAPSHSRTQLLDLVRAVAAPAPPLPADRSESARDDRRLHRLLADLPRGARVLLLSDFTWLDEGNAATLGQLAQRVDLHALCIVDPAERTLPDVGLARFLDLADGRVRWLDTASAAARQAHTEAFAMQRAQRQDRLARLGVPLREVGSETDDLLTYLFSQS